MKSFKVKALAVAVLGLAGLGVMNAASATCPTDPFAAWSSDSGGANSGAQLGGTTVGNSPGLNSTGCAMKATFTTAPGSNGEEAVVYDNSPQKEQTYRFRFYIDPTAVATSLSNINSVEAFSALSSTTHGPVLTQSWYRSTSLVLREPLSCVLLSACSSGDGFLAGRCKVDSERPRASCSLPRVRRSRRRSIDYRCGRNRIVNLWVGTNIGTPDRVINVNNSAWGVSNRMVLLRR